MFFDNTRYRLQTFYKERFFGRHHSTHIDSVVLFQDDFLISLTR